MARLANGEVVPRPSLPSDESQRNCVPFAAPKRTVDEAERLLVKRNGEELAAAIKPKLFWNVKGSWPLLALDVIHASLIAKQPPERLKPTLLVDVAEPETVRPESVVVPKPVPETERNFVAFEVDATSKSGRIWVVVACIARLANGEVVPSPRRPSEESKMNWVPLAAPKRTVEDACRPFVSKSVVDVEFTFAPKLLVGVNGKAKVALWRHAPPTA